MSNLYPQGTYVPMGTYDRSQESQEALDKMLNDFIKESKQMYADAYATYIADGGELDIETFILAENANGMLAAITSVVEQVKNV